jgi:membrane protease YdiL (CAAX protease family)
VPPSRPALWPALVAYAAALVLVLAATSVLFFGVAALRARGRPAQLQPEVARFALSAPGVMSAAAVSATVLALVALVAASLDHSGSEVTLARRLRLRPSRASAAAIAASVAGMAGLSLASGTASDLFGARNTSGTMQQIAHALSDLGRPQDARILIAMATIAVAPGIAEEMFFRGFMQLRLVARWGPWGGIVGSAAAFGLMHLDPLQGTLAFLAGLYLGWVAERLDGIRPTIAAHATNNALFVALAPYAQATAASRVANVTTVIAGLTLFVAAVLLLRSPVATRSRAAQS